MRALTLAVLLLLGCGRTRTYEPVTLPPPPPPPVVPVCMTGSVTGRICAPDAKTFLNGATVSIDAVDCNGAPVHLTTLSGADGSFELDNVPVGAWSVKAQLGEFMQSTLTFVTAGTVHRIPDGGLCVEQRDVKIAVVSGNGDKIENLAEALGLRVTLFPGNAANWSQHGALFLSDLSWMKQFDLILIDCAAAAAPGSHIDLGDNAALIETNLRTYVQGGGSLYASDWAIVFAAYAAPDAFSADGVPAIASPLDTTKLMGFAPQQVTASVDDPGLVEFLGKDTTTINFPMSISVHWGLMAKAAGATVLVSADGVQTCADPTCLTAGPALDGVPLAVTLKVTPATEPGGRVVYTSFHNVQQTGDDVAKMLKYLVLHL
jgi:hypothetical protein